MDTVLSEAPITSDYEAALSPRAIFLAIGDHTCEAVLVAATEGTTRFVAGAPGESWPAGSRIESALRLLSEQCGMSLGIDDIEAVIVQGRPVETLLVGDPDETDRAMLTAIERDGIARIDRSFATPPRNASRIADWARRIATSYDDDGYEALTVLLPIGVLPVWAAHLFNALSASPARSPHNFFVIASCETISGALPSAAQLIERSTALHHALGDALLALHCRRIAPGIPAHAHAVSSIQAVATGTALARQQTDDTIIYLDVADGSTIVIAHPQGIEVLHDAACDAASGAATLLRRIGAEEVARWIPFEIDVAALRAWAIRRVSAPSALLTEPRDRAIAGGFARAAVRALLATSTVMPMPTRCLVGPSLSRFATPSDLMLIVADVLRAPPVTEVATDADGLLPIAGYFAMRSPDSARSLLTHDALTPLGTLLTFPVRGTRAESVVATVVAGEAGASRIVIEQESLTTIRARSTGAVRIIGRDGREESVTAHGGPCGILVDTRARPLTRGGGIGGARGSVSDRLRVGPSAEAAHHD